MRRSTIQRLTLEKRLEGRGSEARAKGVRRRFRRVGWRATSKLEIIVAAILTVAAIVVGLTAIVLFVGGPANVDLHLRHLTAFQNCASARALGLAPARKGEPGYWPQHDADRDGIACEPFSGGDFTAR